MRKTAEVPIGFLDKEAIAESGKGPSESTEAAFSGMANPDSVSYQNLPNFIPRLC